MYVVGLLHVCLVHASADVTQQSTALWSTLLQVTGPFAGEPVQFTVSSGE